MTDSILFSEKNGVGLALLNRPDALNALSHELIAAAHGQLEKWSADPAIRAVIVAPNGGRAFCAGGDLRALYNAKGDLDFGAKFYDIGYRLPYIVANFPKPVISLIDGIVMGGGAGLSIHASRRVLTENTLFAMPECGIGLFPDVGANWFLQPARGIPDPVGLFIALTGYRLNAAEMLPLGLGDYYVESRNIPKLIEALQKDNSDIDAVLQSFSSLPIQQNIILSNQCWIETQFGQNDLGAITAFAPANDFQNIAMRHIRANSPTSMAIAWQAMQKSFDKNLKQVIEMEYHMAQHCLRGEEFFEGIDAAVIRKDRNPAWKPHTIDRLDWQKVERHFQPLSHLRFFL